MNHMRVSKPQIFLNNFSEKQSKKRFYPTNCARFSSHRIKPALWCLPNIVFGISSCSHSGTLIYSVLCNISLPSLGTILPSSVVLVTRRGPMFLMPKHLHNPFFFFLMHLILFILSAKTQQWPHVVCTLHSLYDRHAQLVLRVLHSPHLSRYHAQLEQAGL